MSRENHSKERYRAMRVTVGCETLAFLCSLVAALLADSLTLWANCLRIGLDLPATFFALYVSHRILHSRKGNFDYGLGKWENLSALLNIPMMLVGLAFLAIGAMRSFQHPEPITGTGFGFVMLVVFAGFNFALLRRFHRLNRQAPSPLIHAQFVLYRNAAAASLLSIVTIIGTWIAGDHPAAAYLDIFGAAILALLTIHGMTILVRQSISALLDEAVEESLQMNIMRGLKESFHDYTQLHRIRSRHSGDQIFVELFLTFDAELSASELIERSTRIKRQVENSLPGSEVWVVPVDSTAEGMASEPGLQTR